MTLGLWIRVIRLDSRVDHCDELAHEKTECHDPEIHDLRSKILRSMMVRSKILRSKILRSEIPRSMRSSPIQFSLLVRFSMSVHYPFTKTIKTSVHYPFC